MTRLGVCTLSGCRGVVYVKRQVLSVLPKPAVTLTCPLTVTADDARFMLGTYDKEAEVSPHLFPVQDAAQLLVWPLGP